jgi:VanZ family protein
VRLTARWSGNPRVLRILLGGYLALLAVVGFLPSPADRPINAPLWWIIRWRGQHGLGFISYARVELGTNIALFVLLGMLLALMFGPHRWWLATVICSEATVIIELGQWFLLPQRVASFGDVIADITGGVLGALAAVGIMAAFATRRGLEPHSSGSGDNPSL